MGASCGPRNCVVMPLVRSRTGDQLWKDSVFMTFGCGLGLSHPAHQRLSRLPPAQLCSANTNSQGCSGERGEQAKTPRSREDRTPHECPSLNCRLTDPLSHRVTCRLGPATLTVPFPPGENGMNWPWRSLQASDVCEGPGYRRPSQTLVAVSAPW